MRRQGLKVVVIVKEGKGSHFNKIDEFKGSPESCADMLLKKYVGDTGFKRLGALIYEELKKE